MTQAAFASNFIRQIIDEDRQRKHSSIATRFPPAEWLSAYRRQVYLSDFGMRRTFRVPVNLRFDDTNPAKEEVEYVELSSVSAWLASCGAVPVRISDYFDKLYG
jgi:glutaminyl-tRNA synthetase